MPQRKRPVKRIVALIILAGFIVAPLIFLLRPRTLMDKAIRVASVVDWQDAENWGYNWLSDREVLIFRSKEQGNNTCYVPTRYDLVTHTEAPLGLASAFISTTSTAQPVSDHFELSRDRNWMFWWIADDKTLCVRIE